MLLYPWLAPSGQQLTCPCVSACRGYIPLQVLWHLVSEWAESASPFDVLLQWETKRNCSSVRGKRRQHSSDFQYVPLPTMHQELFKCPSSRNAHELTQWWVPLLFLLLLQETLFFRYIYTYIHTSLSIYKIKLKLAGPAGYYLLSQTSILYSKDLGLNYFLTTYSAQFTG